jgi:hypothetical protein
VDYYILLTHLCEDRALLVRRAGALLCAFLASAATLAPPGDANRTGRLWSARRNKETAGRGEEGKNLETGDGVRLAAAVHNHRALPVRCVLYSVLTIVRLHGAPIHIRSKRYLPARRGRKEGRREPRHVVAAAGVAARQAVAHA